MMIFAHVCMCLSVCKKAHEPMETDETFKVINCKCALAFELTQFKKVATAALSNHTDVGDSVTFADIC